MSNLNLPLWKCHKVVRAAKIIEISISNILGADVLVKVEGGAEIIVNRDRFPPAPYEGLSSSIGGYIVVYEDGYASFSPAKAFESGYTQLPAGIGNLLPHQQRVVIEAAELDEKLGKLTPFLESAVYHNLDDDEQLDLARQRYLMAELSVLLSRRISRFKA